MLLYMIGEIDVRKYFCFNARKYENMYHSNAFMWKSFNFYFLLKSEKKIAMYLQPSVHDYRLNVIL